jgi:hypothetical protein
MRKVARCVTIPVEWQLMGHCFCHTSRYIYAMKPTTQGPEQLAQCPLLFETSFVVRLWVIYTFARFRKACMLRAWTRGDSVEDSLNLEAAIKAIVLLGSR